MNTSLRQLRHPKKCWILSFRVEENEHFSIDHKYDGSPAQEGRISQLRPPAKGWIIRSTVLEHEELTVHSPETIPSLQLRDLEEDTSSSTALEIGRHPRLSIPKPDRCLAQIAK